MQPALILLVKYISDSNVTWEWITEKLLIQQSTTCFFGKETSQFRTFQDLFGTYVQSQDFSGPDEQKLQIQNFSGTMGTQFIA